VREETGLEVKVRKLIGVYSGISHLSRHYILALYYICEITGGSLQLDPTEIDEAKWMKIEDAIQSTQSIFIKQTLKDLQNHL